MSEQVVEEVRRRYADAANAVLARDKAACCGPTDGSC